MKKLPVQMGIAIASAVLLVATVTTATFAQGPGPGNMGPETMAGQCAYGPGIMLQGYDVVDLDEMMQQFVVSCASPDITDGRDMLANQEYRRFADTGRRLTAAEAQQAVATFLAGYYNNPDLEVVELMEFEHNFYAQVAEKSTATNACELLIDPNTGAVQPEYGPNRIWNTKYGQPSDMGGMMPSSRMDGLAPLQPTVNMPVTAEQARTLAQQYLDAQQTGLTVEKDLEVFYGYYTVRSLDKAGNTAGMVSVNGYTGQVWDHIWHGKFIKTASGM